MFRDYPRASASPGGVGGAVTASAPSSSVVHGGGGGVLEASGRSAVGGAGGVWTLEVGGKRFELAGLVPDESKRRGLVFSTKRDGDIEALCEDKEAYRMWLGVAAAVCPATGCGGGGNNNLE